MGSITLTLRSILDSDQPSGDNGDAANKNKDKPLNTVRYGVSTFGATN
jgi:hypothetical protein